MMEEVSDAVNERDFLCLNPAVFDAVVEELLEVGDGELADGLEVGMEATNPDCCLRLSSGSVKDDKVVQDDMTGDGVFFVFYLFIILYLFEVFIGFICLLVLLSYY